MWRWTVRLVCVGEKTKLGKLLFTMTVLSLSHDLNSTD